MTQRLSSIQNKAISQSLHKLQKVTSDSRFRIKSLKMKTVENETNVKQKFATEKNYEEKLISIGFKKQFLRSLYTQRSEESQLKISQPKYKAFIRSIYQKIINTKNLEFSNFNFQYNSACQFLKEFIRINNKKMFVDTNSFKSDFHPIISYNFSNCAYLCESPIKALINSIDGITSSPEDNLEIIIECLNSDNNLTKVALRNLSLNYEQIKFILELIVKNQKIYDLDLSNQSSQTMNRFGNTSDILCNFLEHNKVTSILGLANLSLKRHGIEDIQKGISLNKANPLKILNLKNNAINDQSAPYITFIAKSGLISLDLSDNPLGPQFFMNLTNWKVCTLNYLDLSMTGMNSEALIYFFSRIQECKSIQTLKLDQNDFSHHWFNQTKQMLEVNSSIETLSLSECNIKRFSQTFTGLLNNRYLKKLNISYNQFDQGMKQLCNLIKNNKFIEQIKMKFCNLRIAHMISIISELPNNQTLKVLDISQNFLGQEGASQLIKALNYNNTLNTLILDKMQIPLRLKRQIDDKIKANVSTKKQREFRNLKKENVICKKLDYGSWEDVDNLFKKIRFQNQNIKMLTNKVHIIEKEADKKRNHFYEVTKEYRDRQSKLFSEIDDLEKKLKGVEKQQKQFLESYQKKIFSISNMQDLERKKIEELEEMIKKQSLRNIERENQLEDLLQNSKYIKKKQDKGSKEPISRVGFDATTALKSKRKSKNC